MAALGQNRPWAAGVPTSDLTPIADSNRVNPMVSEVPQADLRGQVQLSLRQPRLS